MREDDIRFPFHVQGRLGGSSGESCAGLIKHPRLRFRTVSQQSFHRRSQSVRSSASLGLNSEDGFYLVVPEGFG
jgi:hypothetical protein